MRSFVLLGAVLIRSPETIKNLATRKDIFDQIPDKKRLVGLQRERWMGILGITLLVVGFALR